jgi:hypothetical protein
MDWSSLGALHGQKFGGIGIAFTKCIVLDIPYTPIPKWFKKNPRLVDEPRLVENRMEELRKQHAEEIREYKARIFELENQVATLTMGEAGSSSCTLINLQSLEAERDTTLKEAKIAQSQVLEVSTMNEVMRREMEVLQKEVVDMQQ